MKVKESLLWKGDKLTHHTPEFHGTLELAAITCETTIVSIDHIYMVTYCVDLTMQPKSNMDVTLISENGCIQKSLRN